tara:strand:- start:751 stop:1314 length:564 start_codon:yes stop_codon:yes gene_type:complete
MSELSDTQWKQITKKYGKLMWMISHRVGGDTITNSVEDSYQELSMSAMDAVRTFSNKTTKPFDEFFSTKEFDKYIKTCLWNKKNSLGIKIQKKKVVNNAMSFEPELVSEEETYEGSGIPIDVSGFADIELDDECRKVVEVILRDGKVIKPNGKININRLVRETGKSKPRIKYIIERLESYYQDYENE